MEKAYDVKELIAKVKAQGLDLTEEAVKLVTVSVCDWISESAVLSTTPYDNLLIPFMPILKEKLLAVEDKIDGKVG